MTPSDAVSTITAAPTPSGNSQSRSHAELFIDLLRNDLVIG